MEIACLIFTVFFATDLKLENAVDQWLGHAGEVHTVLFDFDETSCYSIGSDGKVSYLISSCATTGIYRYSV